jgi:hypothetical protein
MRDLDSPEFIESISIRVTTATGTRTDNVVMGILFLAFM